MHLLSKAVTYRKRAPVTQIQRYISGACFSLCPRCGKCLDREYMRYCSLCGQRLDWRSLETAQIIDVPCQATPRVERCSMADKVD